MTASVEAAVTVAGDVESVFAAMVELRSQDQWMLGTRLFQLEAGAPPPGVGSKMAALTGVGGVGVLDLMEVTEYDPPRRWVVSHQGRAIRGIGIFEVHPTAGGARASWREELDLPLGVLGRLGWPVVAPAVRWGLRRSLDRLAAGVRDGTLPTRPAPGPRAGGTTPENGG